MKRNLFIALEGIDGSGKSTQAKLLAEKLCSCGHKVYTTFEPTDGSVGTILRNILKGAVKADERVIAGLFVADRLDHLLNDTNGIIKKLNEGYTVITDRYYFSSYAYNGAHLDMDWVINANAMSAKILRPHTNIYIDLDTDIAMKRLMNNRQSIDLYETSANLKKVKEKYIEAFEKLKGEERIFITNGDLPVEAIADNIWNEVQRILEVEGAVGVK